MEVGGGWWVLRISRNEPQKKMPATVSTWCVAVEEEDGREDWGRGGAEVEKARGWPFV